MRRSAIRTGPKASKHCRRGGTAHRLVISKVVPKIWDRTNSAMMEELDVKERRSGLRKRKKDFLRSEGGRREERGLVSRGGQEDRRTREERPPEAEEFEWAETMMWGRALSVKSAENKADDVCDQRQAGFHPTTGLISHSDSYLTR